MRTAACLLAALVLLIASGCAKQRPEKVPGDSDVAFRSVSIVGAGGKSLSLSGGPLLGKLGQRAGGIILTPRYYNPYRLAEDRRRIESYWQNAGYFDVKVSEPALQIDQAAQRADVTWTVTEGPRYALASVGFRGLPAGSESAVRSLAPFSAGSSMDLEAIRVARYAMAERLQRDGFGHARVIVRFYVNRSRREVSAVYMADPGPITRVGKVTVEGTRKVNADDVLARAGLTPGQPFSLTSKEKAEFDLLDTGAFATAVASTTADVERYLGEVPDSGGVIDPSQVDGEGNLVPRPLADTVDIVLHVNEAPSRRLDLRGTFEGDPTRLDATAGAGLLLRNALGSLHHITLRGSLGYGWLWRGDTDEPTGVYGEALAQYNHPGALGRLGDLRLTARYRDTLYPGFHLREATVGPGLRSTFAPRAFIDLDLLFRRGQAVGFGPFDAATRDRLSLPEDDVASGAEASASVLLDRRDDPAEPMAGYLLSLRGTYAPGGGLGTNRYLVASPEARFFLPLTTGFSLGLRGSGGWVGLGDAKGVPLGPRLFGGGAFGMRGFGRDRLSPSGQTCAAGVDPAAPQDPSQCHQEVTGALSLVESSLEARLLPPQRQLGLVAFLDAGGAGAAANPFASGLDLAVGLGPRLRLWYMPISIDVSYHLMHEGKLGGRDVLLFLRVGEAF
jgi:outer membrane translocation and assembly module TamA